MPVVNTGAAALPKELKMKTNSRFHRVATFAFAAVFAAAIGVRPVEGAPASVTVMNAAGEATLSTDGETWQSSVTVEVQPGGCVQVHDKAGFVRLVPAVAGTYYALSNCTGMVTDPSARTTIRPDGKTAVVFTNALTSTFLPGGPSLVSEALAVGGGGAGGNTMAGGGGGGGVVLSNALCAVSAGDAFAVTVGAGGTRGKNQYDAGNNGGESSLSVNGVVKMSALGGGGGGGWTSVSKSGGSGGGASGGCNNRNGGAGTPGQGFDGAAALRANYGSGGGGGAGGLGRQADGDARIAGRGGMGFVSSITGTARMYGAGGGAGGSSSNYDTYDGGEGGDPASGAGHGGKGGAGTPGADGTGGGGGGGGWTGSLQYGGVGGSGTVILVLENLDPGLTVDGDPDAWGAEGVPEYGKHRMDDGVERTFTAPSAGVRDDAGVERALCLGYRMDTFDPESQQWVLGNETNESLSCTYVQNGTERRRLMWIWREQSLMSLVNASGDATLSFDGGETWFASTNAWLDVGSEVVVTVREDMRDVLKLTGPGVAVRPDGSYAVTISGPVSVEVKINSTVLYVSDGLVAFWDVQSNVGSGYMVSDTNRWYDTVDSSRYWQLIGRCCFSGATAAMEIPSGASCSFSGTMPTFLTCETCARWDAGERFFSLANSYGGLCFNVMGALASPSEYHANGSRVRVATSGVPDTFAVLCSSMTAGDKGFYRRGIIQGANIGAFAPYGSQNAVGYGLGGIYSQGTASFKGGVYALRLYSRRLSGDELKRNAVLDGSRYLGRALPDGWRIENSHLQVRLSFDLGPDVTVSAGGAQVATDAPVWLNAGTEVTATATPGEGEYAIWNGAPQEATFADGGNTITFTLHAPRTLECELLKPDLVWAGGETKVNYSNDAAVVYLPAGTVSGTAVWAKRLVLGGGATAAALTLTKGVTLSDRLDVNRSATLTINSASVVSNGVTVRTGGTITHTKNGSSDVNKVDLTTAGAMVVEEFGKVTADACGMTSQGTMAAARRTVENPTGSGSSTDNGLYGGGVVRLAVAGALTVDGEVTARGGNASTTCSYGGSVWVTAGSLKGFGTMCADGGSILHWGGCAGGRLACRLTDPDADFSDFTGECAANGSCNYQKPDQCGPSGTVYLRTGSDYGSLIITANNTKGNRTVGYPSGQTELDVERIVVTNGATLSVSSAVKIRVHGDVTAYDGTLTSTSAACMEFVDATRQSHLAGGTQTYPQFVCREPGKEIYFASAAAAPTYQVAEGAAFTITGSKEDPVWLLPSDPAGFWALRLQADVARDVKYAAVSNSQALSGLAVTVQGGRDLGGNDGGWAFVDFIEPGAPMRWTGAEGSDWKSKNNWIPAREPIATDDITILSETEDGTAVTNFPVIDAGIGTPLLSKLTIRTGAKLTIDGGGLLVTNLLSVQSGGLLDVKGSEVVTVSGDLAFANAACFGCGKGRVILTGDLVQQFDAGTATFNRIYVRKTGGGVAWNDGLTADYFECTTTENLAFTFQNGKTFALTQMYLCGLADGAAKLSLASSSPDDCWHLRATTAQRVAGVTVADSDATGGAPVYTGAPSSGNDNTPGWNFGGTCTEWTGKKGDGKFATAGNWSDGVVPGPTSRVAIPCAEGGSVTITMPTTDVVLSNLVVGVGGGTVNLTVNGMLNVTEDLELREKVTMTFNTKKVCTVGRDVMLRSGAKVTHTANTGSADSYAVDMAVGRNFTVEDTATVTADGLGRTATYAIHGGSSGYNNAVDGEQGACYDSVFEPILSGGDGNKKGGGIVHLTVDGTLSVYGSVTANGYSDSRKVASDGYGSGAGGSVWITCARLVGSGLIAADGGCGWHTGNLGGGGRVAVQLTDSAADFDAFGGTVQALYGRNDQYGGEYPSGGCGTVSLRTADGVGEIRIGDIENNLNKKLQNTSWTDLPMAADGSARKAYKQQTVVLGKRGRLRLTDDVTIQDLVLEKCVNGLADFKRNIMLNGHTLTIVSRAHKDGKGWYSGWENYVIKGSNSVTGAKGKIVWKGGMCLIIR